MRNLKVIPVIDILNGKAVHAVRGKRSEYQPLQSVLCDSTEPLEVAKAFKRLGFHELYVADLDAIIDCSLDFQVFKQIADKTGLDLMVDAGITSLERAKILLENAVSKMVIGTETLRNKNFVGEALKTFGSSRVVVSLDLKGDRVLTRSGFDTSADPMRLLGDFRNSGVTQVIVLDLARVGSGEGVNIGFLKKALEIASMDVYVGGGVRSLADLMELRDLGVSGVLVATALHSGKISLAELRRTGLL